MIFQHPECPFNSRMKPDFNFFSCFPFPFFSFSRVHFFLFIFFFHFFLCLLFVSCSSPFSLIVFFRISFLCFFLGGGSVFLSFPFFPFPFLFSPFQIFLFIFLVFLLTLHFFRLLSIYFSYFSFLCFSDEIIFHSLSLQLQIKERKIEELTFLLYAIL